MSTEREHDERREGTPPHGDPLGAEADAAPTEVGDADASRHGRPAAPDPGGAADTGAAAEPEAPEEGASEPATGQDAAASDAEARAADFRDKYLRAEAELQNVRRRAARDVAAAQDRGVAKLARELLTAFDHLELALQAAEQHDAGEWVKGIRLVQSELTAALARAGIEAFSPQGEPFDPNEHEAMAQQPSDDAESGTVLQVYQQGYRLNGQVLRPARVVVAGGAS